MAGLPGVDNFAAYGGAIANYLIDVIDPTTDEDAAVRNVYVANVAAMTNTVTRAMLSFLGPTAGQTMLSAPLKGFVHDSVWGNSPGVKPIGTYVSQGIVDVAWPTTVTDELLQTHTLELKRAFVTVEPPDSDTAAAFAKATVVANNKIRVYTSDELMGVADLVGHVITVWVR